MRELGRRVPAAGLNKGGKELRRQSCSLNCTCSLLASYLHVGCYLQQGVAAIARTAVTFLLCPLNSEKWKHVAGECWHISPYNGGLLTRLAILLNADRWVCSSMIYF